MDTRSNTAKPSTNAAPRPAPGRIHLVTILTRNRAPVFRELSPARLVVNVLRREQRLGRARTLAYVLMPEQLCWLLTPADGLSLSTVVGAVKSTSAHWLRRRPWAGGFRARSLGSNEDVQGVARRMVAHPLRAGLVEHIGLYPHWDAIWLQAASPHGGQAEQAGAE